VVGYFRIPNPIDHFLMLYLHVVCPLGNARLPCGAVHDHCAIITQRGSLISHVDVSAAVERYQGLGCKLMLHSSQHPGPDPGVILTPKVRPNFYDAYRTEQRMHTCAEVCNQVLDSVRNH
jgi:hypothetical protein